MQSYQASAPDISHISETKSKRKRIKTIFCSQSNRRLSILPIKKNKQKQIKKCDK